MSVSCPPNTITPPFLSASKDYGLYGTLCGTSTTFSTYSIFDTSTIFSTLDDKLRGCNKKMSYMHMQKPTSLISCISWYMFVVSFLRFAMTIDFIEGFKFHIKAQMPIDRTRKAFLLDKAWKCILALFIAVGPIFLWVRFLKTYFSRRAGQRTPNNGFVWRVRS